MIITTKQAQEILGVKKAAFRALIEAGKIKPVNERKNGAQRFYARFDSTAIRAYQKEQKEELGALRKVKATPAPTPTPVLAPLTVSSGPNTLQRIETKIDLLLSAWGISIG